MIYLREAILVEGKHDVIRLQSFVGSPILETRGFRIFKDGEQAALLRRIAARRGLIVLTDSDDAGMVIRGHVSGLLPPDQVRHAYVPPVPGREKRKHRPSKAGLLGVEGLTPAVIEAALRRAGATFLPPPDGPAVDGASGAPFPPDANALSEPSLSASDLYDLGYSGREDSARRRAAVLAALGFPPSMTAARFLSVLNAAFSREEALERLTKAAEFPDIEE